jgi:hypothetical protein
MNGAYGEGILAVTRLIETVEVAAAYVSIAVIVSLIVLLLTNCRNAK